ncbi:MAG: citrate/2-methylcitrate synthase, partial [Micavibrio sp.]
MSDDITTDKTFTLTNDATGESVKLPVLHGTSGPDVLDVRKLYAQTGHFTFDPSYTSTASCKSRLTFIDGDEGILHHRGYDIKELARKSTFMEVCHLLLDGDLPTQEQLAKFTHNITYHTMVH